MTFCKIGGSFLLLYKKLHLLKLASATVPVHCGVSNGNPTDSSTRSKTSELLRGGTKCCYRYLDITVYSVLFLAWVVTFALFFALGVRFSVFLPQITRVRVKRYPQDSDLMPHCQFTVKWNGADRDLEQVMCLEGAEERRDFFHLMCSYQGSVFQLWTV